MSVLTSRDFFRWAEELESGRWAQYQDDYFAETPNRACAMGVFWVTQYGEAQARELAALPGKPGGLPPAVVALHREADQALSAMTCRLLGLSLPQGSWSEQHSIATLNDCDGVTFAEFARAARLVGHQRAEFEGAPEVRQGQAVRS